MARFLAVATPVTVAAGGTKGAFTIKIIIFFCRLAVGADPSAGTLSHLGRVRAIAASFWA